MNIEYKINENGCYICTSHVKDKDGYPIITNNYKKMPMNRYIYMTEIGIIKENNVIMHTCDNPSCINPTHLIQGTVSDNNKDCRDKGRFPIVRVTGSKNGMSKLTPEEVIDIRSRRMTAQEFANFYGMAKRNIINIWSNKSYKDSIYYSEKKVG